MTDHRKLFCFKNPAGSSTADIHGFERYIRKEKMIRPGLWLSIINFMPEQPLQIEYERQHQVVDFGFAVSADIQKKTGENRAGTKEQVVKSGTSGVQYAGEQSGVFLIRPKEKQQILHIHASLPFLKKVLEGESASLPAFLAEVIGQSATRCFSRLFKMTPDIQAVAYQMLNSSANALPWNLYLEAKVLELLSLQLAALKMDHGRPDPVLLTAQEKEQVLKARTLLIRDLHSPPTLEGLSTETGLSAGKLQAGFRNLYGKSVFDYFREYRLQTAKLLLGQGRTNVSQTAWQIGYVNVSHFGAAFKKRFGILPKQYLKTALKNQVRIGSTIT